MNTPAAEVPERQEPDGHADASRQGLLLEWLTIGWNVLEVAVTVALGLAAHSLALIAFGMDSLVEVFASLVVVWHIGGGRAQTPQRRSRALRLVAVAFALLAAYLVAGSAHALLTRQRPESSPWGMAYLAVTALVMFALAHRKRVLGADLGNHPLAAEASMTFLDGCLAVGILAALAALAVFGWWWADPVAATAIAVAAIVEARGNWREAGEG